MLKTFFGKPAELWNKNNVNWLPRFKLGHLKRKQLSKGTVERCEIAKRRQDEQRHAEDINILFQQQIESVLSNELEEVIKEEIDVSTELFEDLFTLETATESVIKQMLLETIMSIEKEIVQEEWEMAAVNYNVISLMYVRIESVVTISWITSGTDEIESKNSYHCEACQIPQTTKENHLCKSHHQGDTALWKFSMHFLWRSL